MLNLVRPSRTHLDILSLEWLVGAGWPPRPSRDVARLGRRKCEKNGSLRREESWPVTLREPNVPLDNNLVERALKIAILSRKNALFYKMLNGAQVGDLFMSLIHTCELNRANPFDYLTELQQHSAELAIRSAEWMPWNYRETLARLANDAVA